MSEEREARQLVEEALHIRMHGERPPGAPPWPAETWRDWDRRAEAWLRSSTPDRTPDDASTGEPYRALDDEAERRLHEWLDHALGPAGEATPEIVAARVRLMGIVAALVTQAVETGR